MIEKKGIPRNTRLISYSQALDGKIKSLQNFQRVTIKNFQKKEWIMLRFMWNGAGVFQGLFLKSNWTEPNFINRKKNADRNRLELIICSCLERKNLEDRNIRFHVYLIWSSIETVIQRILEKLKRNCRELEYWRSRENEPAVLTADALCNRGRKTFCKKNIERCFFNTLSTIGLRRNYCKFKRRFKN